MGSRRIVFVGFLTFLATLAAASFAPARASDLGPFGPEGPRMREQLWMLPSGSPGLALRATVFRPAEVDGAPTRRPLVVVNHGTSEATRQAVAMPVYYWLSRWFVERGYVVVLPQRRGHGATGGDLVEARGSCKDPHHYASGQVAADDVEAVVRYMTQQPFVADSVVVAGISTGGWAALALAERQLPAVRAIVNFAGGRGGHAFGQPHRICDAEQLVAAAGRYATRSSAPTLWLYSSNDSFFGPVLARAMANAWVANGGLAELHVLPPYGQDGHTLADDQAGWQLWGRSLETFLAASPELAAEMRSTAPSIVRPASVR